MNQKKRSGFQVMLGLIGMIKPLLGIMLLAILMGCIGNLMATFLTVLGGYGLLAVTGIYDGIPFRTVMILVLVFAVARGFLRYAEQACNHFIAFKLLARIRHQVFAALRRLCPTKLDGSQKGNLISIITSDIELLEVFYAHTISPVAIAVLTSVFMILYFASLHPLLAFPAFLAYLLVGLVIPLVNGRIGGADGKKYRDSFGALNAGVLDNLYGLEEIIQYDAKKVRMERMTFLTENLEKVNRKLKRSENVSRIVTDAAILFEGVFMALYAADLTRQGVIEGYESLIAVIAMMSSFGPTAALSSLSNNLHHTLASGNRVLDILEEEPLVEEVTDGTDSLDGEISCRQVEFTYPDTQEKILDGFDAVFARGKIHGILGKRGCGKSTLLKLFMRFYETDAGKIASGDTDVNDINTMALRNRISYVTQETFLFQDTIENNIKIGKPEATREEVVEAAKAASIHDFIESLPNGYETKLAELGDSVSGGEKQRIGIARAFLHRSDILFLDEPTSNIDSLNEGMILRALEQQKADKTILLVSHRKSTMGIADECFFLLKNIIHLCHE